MGRLVNFFGAGAVAVMAAGCSVPREEVPNLRIGAKIEKQEAAKAASGAWATSVEAIAVPVPIHSKEAIAWQRGTSRTFIFDIPKSLVQTLPHHNVMMDKTRWMTLGLKSVSLPGQKSFCEIHSDQCGFKQFSPHVIVYSAALLQMLVDLNTKTNKFYLPKEDKEIYGIDELWNLPNLYADCDDYAAVKRKMLIDAGFPPSALLLTHVNDPQGGSHLVLAVRTTEGDFMMDNLTNDVKRWNEMGYKAVHRAVDPRNSESWLQVGTVFNFEMLNEFRFQ